MFTYFRGLAGILLNLICPLKVYEQSIEQIGLLTIALQSYETDIRWSVLWWDQHMSVTRLLCPFRATTASLITGSASKLSAAMQVFIYKERKQAERLGLKVIATMYLPIRETSVERAGFIVAQNHCTYSQFAIILDTITICFDYHDVWISTRRFLSVVMRMLMTIDKYLGSRLGTLRNRIAF